MYMAIQLTYLPSSYTSKVMGLGFQLVRGKVYFWLILSRNFPFDFLGFGLEPLSPELLLLFSLVVFYLLEVRSAGKVGDICRSPVLFVPTGQVH